MPAAEHAPAIPSDETVHIRKGSFVALSRHPVLIIDSPKYDEFATYGRETFERAFSLSVPETAQAGELAAILGRAESRGMPDRAGHLARLAWRDASGRVVTAE